jgi:hypothetical protein
VRRFDEAGRGYASAIEEGGVLEGAGRLDADVEIVRYCRKGAWGEHSARRKDMKVETNSSRRRSTYAREEGQRKKEKETQERKRTWKDRNAKWSGRSKAGFCQRRRHGRREHAREGKAKGERKRAKEERVSLNARILVESAAKQLVHDGGRGGVVLQAVLDLLQAFALTGGTALQFEDVSLARKGERKTERCEQEKAKKSTHLVPSIRSHSLMIILHIRTRQARIRIATAIRRHSPIRLLLIQLCLELPLLLPVLFLADLDDPTVFGSAIGVIFGGVEGRAVFCPDEVAGLLVNDDAVDLPLLTVQVEDALRLEAGTRTAFEVDVFAGAFVEPLQKREKRQ